MDSYINQPLWQNGPVPGSFHDFPNKTAGVSGPSKHTMYPMVTGSSVLGVKFDGGVMIAADKLGSYGSMARYRNCDRVLKVNDEVVLAAGGDYADYQFIKNVIEQNVNEEQCRDEGFRFTPRALYSWITRVFYNRRSKINPLWNTVVVGGLQNGEPFLGYVDKIGTAYESPSVASGFGAYIAQPMMRDALEKNANMTEVEAKKLLERCLKVLFYRDARSWNSYDIAMVTKDGARVEGPLSAQTNWNIANMVKGYE